jgi:hypothetical protein
LLLWRIGPMELTEAITRLSSDEEFHSCPLYFVKKNLALWTASYRCRVISHLLTLRTSLEKTNKNTTSAPFFLGSNQAKTYRSIYFLGRLRLKRSHPLKLSWTIGGRNVVDVRGKSGLGSLSPSHSASDESSKLDSGLEPRPG